MTQIDILDLTLPESTENVLAELKFSKLNVPASIQSAEELVQVHDNYVHDLKILLEDAPFWSLLQELNQQNKELVPAVHKELERYQEFIQNAPFSI